MELSQEELAYFSGMFSEKKQTESVRSQHKLSVKSDIPTTLYQVFEQSKLTLLAEVSHYQLWFPLEITVEAGEFRPVLGTPEIVDVEKAERSWRSAALSDVTARCQNGERYDLVSLSSTGIAFRSNNLCQSKNLPLNKKLTLSLADESDIDVEFETVRVEHDVVAARIANVKKGRERLRKFLFNLHRSENKQLYQGVVSDKI